MGRVMVGMERDCCDSFLDCGRLPGICFVRNMDGV